MDSNRYYRSVGKITDIKKIESLLNKVLHDKSSGEDEDHQRADALLVQALRILNPEASKKIIRLYKKVFKWYA